MRNLPLPLTMVAPSGIGTDPVGPTAVIRRPSTSTVMFRLGPAPVASTTVTRSTARVALGPEAEVLGRAVAAGADRTPATAPADPASIVRRVMVLSMHLSSRSPLP
jgi:hypothetical protein